MKRVVIFVIAIIFSIGTFAQLIMGKSALMKHIEDVVKPAFFLSKQTFQISDKKSGDLYGLNGKKEFGTQYTIGVKVANGYLLTDNAVRPWQYNNRFAKYKEKYTPVPYTSTYTELGEKANYSDVSIANPVALNDSLLYMFKGDAFGGKGLKIDTSKGAKDGWLVWVTAERNLNLEQTADAGFYAVKKAITIDKAKPLIDIDVPKYQTDSIIGAIYVVPEYAEIGTIVFKLCGIAVDNGGKWQLVCPFVGMTFDEAKSEKPKEGNAGSVSGGNNDDNEPAELTPVEKPAKDKGKKKKNKKD